MKSTTVSEIDHASMDMGLSLRSDPNLTKKVKSNTALNKVSVEDRKFHDWYRFVLSFPPHLVREYLIDRFKLNPGDTVLDPFCGTGTTVVEAKINGLNSVGIEANKVAHLAGKVKVNWDIDVDALISTAEKIYEKCKIKLANESALRGITEEQEKLILKNSICPLPLHKSMILIEQCESASDVEGMKDLLRIATAKTLVSTSSNLHFGPEVGVRGRKSDAPVFEEWLKTVQQMAEDLRSVHGKPSSSANVILGDARDISSYLAPNSIDAVFTSPPYPNEKDYTRTTRLETVLLGFAKNKEELRAIKKGLIRSNTRGVYKADSDDKWIESNKTVTAIAEEIERRRIELGKTSGFEKLYARVTKLYFGGMARHLAELRPFLKKGAMLGYVVGDQASYLQVMIRTGSILAEIAEELGYEVVGIDLFRTRISTVTKAYMREEVVVLRWNK